MRDGDCVVGVEWDQVLGQVVEKVHRVVVEGMERRIEVLFVVKDFLLWVGVIHSQEMEIVVQKRCRHSWI